MTTAGINWSILIIRPGNFFLIGYQMFSVSALYVLLWLDGDGGDTIRVSLFASWEQFRCLPPSIRAGSLPCPPQHDQIQEADRQVTTTTQTSPTNPDRRSSGGRLRTPGPRSDLPSSSHPPAQRPAQPDDPGHQEQAAGLGQGRPSERHVRPPA